jgi:hypothetical protein
MSIEHKDIPPEDRHPYHAWVVADAAARGMVGATSLDIGKVAWQLDDHSEWKLIGVGLSGNVWKRQNDIPPVSSVSGRTGAIVLTKADVSLGNVDNTSDANKPLSTAALSALAGKEGLGTADALMDAHIIGGHPQYLTSGDLSDQIQSARALSKTKALSNGTTVLTAAEVNSSSLTFTGTLTGNATVEIPVASVPGMFSVTNSTTGGYSLAVKAAGQTSGAVVVPTQSTLALGHNTTSVYLVSGATYPITAVIPFAANLVLDWSKYDTAYVVLNGNCYLTNINARPGQKCHLYLEQAGGTNIVSYNSESVQYGGDPVTATTGVGTISFGPEVAFGINVPNVTLSTEVGKVDELGFNYNWVKNKYNLVAMAKGF